MNGEWVWESSLGVDTLKEKENTVEKREKRKLFLTDMWGWRVKERCGRDEEDKGKGGGELRWMRDMGPDAQINYSLHSSILSCQLPFIEPVRCPLRMAWEEKCHSCQGLKRRTKSGETEEKNEIWNLLGCFHALSTRKELIKNTPAFIYNDQFSLRSL